jgi:hypothetical protein
MQAGEKEIDQWCHKGIGPHADKVGDEQGNLVGKSEGKASPQLRDGEKAQCQCYQERA